MGGVSLVLGMVIARDREEGTVTITPEKYSRSLLERYGIARSNSCLLYTSDAADE